MHNSSTKSSKTKRGYSHIYTNHESKTTTCNIIVEVSNTQNGIFQKSCIFSLQYSSYSYFLIASKTKKGKTDKLGLYKSIDSIRVTRKRIIRGYLEESMRSPRTRGRN
jgi:hypothetical protein